MNNPSNYILILDSITDYRDTDVIAKVNKIITTRYGDECKCVTAIDVKNINGNVLMGDADMYVFAECESPSKKFITVLNNMSDDDYVLEINSTLLKHVHLDKDNKYVILMPWNCYSSVILPKVVAHCKKTADKYLKNAICVGGDVPKTGDMSPYNLFLDVLQALNDADVVVCYPDSLKEKESGLYKAALDVAKLKHKALMFI